MNSILSTPHFCNIDNALLLHGVLKLSSGPTSILSLIILFVVNIYELVGSINSVNILVSLSVSFVWVFI